MATGWSLWKSPDSTVRLALESVCLGSVSQWEWLRHAAAAVPLQAKLVWGCLIIAPRHG